MCGHIQADVIAERQLVRAAVRLCVVRWLCRLRLLSSSGAPFQALGFGARLARASAPSVQQVRDCDHGALAPSVACMLVFFLVCLRSFLLAFSFSDSHLAHTIGRINEIGANG